MNKSQDILISTDAKIIDALVQLNESRKKILICTDADGGLAGVVADGDIRRALINGKRPEDPIVYALNKEPIFVNEQASYQEAQGLLTDKISIIPILDPRRRVKGYYQYKERKDLTVIKNRSITILGLGYVGLTLALILAEKGFTVRGFDVDQGLLENLQNGKAPFFEKGLKELLVKHVGSNLKLFKKIENAKSDIYIITVGTPIFSPKKEPNIGYIRKAATSIAGVLESGDMVILRSTVPIGCTRKEVLPILEEVSRLRCGKDFCLAFAPERTIEGIALQELLRNPQIIGAYDERSYHLTARLFNEITPTLINVGSLEAAEMGKLLDNTFRDHIFAYSNLMAVLSERLGVNFHKLIEAVNFGYHRNMIPKPSPGVGGPCLSKDPYILKNAFDTLGLEASILQVTREINEIGPSYIKQKLEVLLEKVGKSLGRCKKIGLVGMAFKGYPETSDLRDSTSVWFLDQLPDKRIVWAYDPVVADEDLSDLGITPASLENTFKGADAVVILNNHKSYGAWNIHGLLHSMNKPAVLIDTWYNFDPMLFKQASGVLYGGLGND